MASTVPQFLDKIDRVTREIGSNRPAVQATALAAKTIFITEAAKKGVGRGVGKTVVSKRVSASYDLKGGEQDAKAIVRYTGPAHLVNNPTKAHVIRPRKFVGTRGSGARAMKGAALLSIFGVDAHSAGRGGIVLPGVGVRRFANHPGTRGLRFAQKAVTKCKDECPKVYKRAGIEAPLRKVFQ